MSQAFLPFTPDHIAPSTMTTPYGTLTYRRYHGLCWIEPSSPHTLVYAAKELGTTHLIEIAPLYAVNRLLTPGDVLIPQDFLDLTQGRVPTFFVGKGYGFVQQHPPYCPYLRSFLIDTAYRALATFPMTKRPRVFRRGTYAGIEATAIPAYEQHPLPIWGADAVGQAGIPTSVLARELELCYAMLGMVIAPESTDEAPYGLAALVHQLVQDAPSLPTHERSCVCATAMHAPRTRGLIDEDWHTWVA
jgi:5'-methylthioadenosine phosphorylase